MTDLHTKAMLAQDFARLALYHLDRPDDAKLAELVDQAELALAEALSAEERAVPT